jgi:hypothetical protein
MSAKIKYEKREIKRKLRVQDYRKPEQMLLASSYSHGEKMGILPSSKLGFADLLSHKWDSLRSHYETRFIC